ncbi:anthranilate phosphoribosyltransferase [Alkalihalophilus pseudofirmus]|uniref:anthranilate phosphoribosyltransferase n=1 Tax=Alkalihalophilus pseudofirmus TaxID=79885 RepID=UPI00259AFA8B|nr:anthranilate phosphoribosyltransferase [Alkalihalophilus pseudofirmus]WEG18353.1 anthranilate phosphoribosyltransferase [Alkalihalophilus pseudofirmus]
MFKQLLRKCMEGVTLSETEAQFVMDEIMGGKATPSQIASLLTVLRFRGETVEEMIGFAKSMRSHSVTIPHTQPGVVDTCGTGGDDLSTFNISTAVALVLSAMGVPVAKHGNRAVSSKSGSADVLEELRIEIQSTPELAAESLKNNQLCFLFAPLYHQSMKHAVAPRKEIGFRTIFNLLGPITNPARAEHQLVGVYNEDFAYKMAQTLKELGTTHTVFATGGEGLDECSITRETTLYDVIGTTITKMKITPEDVGLTRGKMEDIQVNNAQESAEVINQVVRGTANQSAQDIVTLNAAVALYAADRCNSISDGVDEVKKAIQSGIVYKHVTSLQTERRQSQHA